MVYGSSGFPLNPTPIGPRPICQANKVAQRLNVILRAKVKQSVCISTIHIYRNILTPSIETYTMRSYPTRMTIPGPRSQDRARRSGRSHSALLRDVRAVIPIFYLPCCPARRLPIVYPPCRLACLLIDHALQRSFRLPIRERRQIKVVCRVLDQPARSEANKHVSDGGRK